MPFGLGKSRRRQLADLSGDWVGWLDPGVEVEGKMKVASGLIRVNTHFKGEINSEGAVVVHDQGEVDGDIRTRILSVTGKIKGNVHASERLEIKEHGVVLGSIYTPCLLVDPGGFFDGQCHMPTPGPAAQPTPAPEAKNNSPDAARPVEDAPAPH
jgi:cytoskeletal protein CcmA (bactofilin family)